MNDTRRTAASILHELAGSPPQDGCAPIDGEHRCWVCAAIVARGMLVNDWTAASYTDQNKARSPASPYVCEPCVWTCAWNQPPGFPPPEPGKKGLNLRLFSHLYDDRGYLALNKASKPDILRWLREPKVGPWFAAIADTGQKHVLPWTPVNPAGSLGTVRFEDRNIILPRGERWQIIDDMTALLTSGTTKDELASGRYSWLTLQHARAAARSFEDRHGQQLRGSPWYDLALWLSQRDEEKANEIQADRAAKRDAEKQARGRAARVPRRVPSKRSEPAQALGPDARPAARGRPAKRDSGADAGQARTHAPTAGARQLDIFQDAGADD